MLGQATSNLLTGQAKVAVTGTQVPISAATVGLQNGVTLKADKNNAAAVFVGQSTINNTGGGTGNGFMLYPGDTLSVAVTALSFLALNGTAGDFITWAAN